MADGVPLMAPLLGSIDKPGGSGVVRLTDHVIGAVPPEALKVAAYGLEMVASGRGDGVVMVGGGLIVNVAGVEVKPPEMITVMTTRRAVVPTCAEEIGADIVGGAANEHVSVVVDVRGVPSQTIVPVGNSICGGQKPVPVTVSVNPGPPAVHALGLRLVIVTGFMVRENVLVAVAPRASLTVTTGL